MPDWSPTPPPMRHWAGVSLKRVPPGTPITGIATSEQLLGCTTHWAHGRTLPCDPPDCAHCAERLPRRWHAYLSYVDLPTGKQHVLELTGLGADGMREAIARFGQLRGLRFKAQRSNKRPNAPVQIAARIDESGTAALPPPIDVREFMTDLWATGLAAHPLVPLSERIPETDVNK